MVDKAAVRLEDKTYGMTNGLRPSSIGVAPYYSSAPIPPAPPSTVMLVFPMRGKHAVFGWIYWLVNDVPDLTGASSGYPGLLTLITHDEPLYITVTAGEELMGVSIDGSGAVIVIGSKGNREIAFDCTIYGWTLLADVAGSIVIDVKKSTYAAWPATVSICGGVYPTLVGVQKNQSIVGGCIGTSLLAGDIIEFEVIGVPVIITKAWLFLRVRRA